MFINSQALKSLSYRLLSVVRYSCTIAKQRSAIFQSQYHKNGPLSIKPTKNIQFMLAKHYRKIVQMQNELEIKRKTVLAAQINTKQGDIVKLQSGQKKILEVYLQIYFNFTKVISGCPLNNEYIYKLIGWYNMIAFYKSLVERLIESSEQQLPYLIISLNWMKYKWQNPYGIIDQDLFNGKNIQNFYKRIINYSLRISELKQLQNVLVVPINFSKKMFYYKYFSNNIEQMLKLLIISQNYTLSDLIWTMHQYVKNMNDEQNCIAILQKFLINNRPSLSNEDIQNLMSSYLLKGRINKIVYNTMIKPYIFKHKMSEIGDAIQMIKFTVCSQSEDTSLLKTLYELIQVLYNKNKISASRHMYTLHLYTHYLNIKGFKIRFNPTLQKQITQFCKQRAEGRNSINKIVYNLVNPQNKANRNYKPKYVSPCLNISKVVLTEFEQTKKSQFQKSFGFRLAQFDLKESQLYEKPIFCCFQLDYCLHNKVRSQLIDVQIEGIQYVFTSGKLVRERQIKDQILTYYGFKINHINYNNLKMNKSFDMDEVLMYKRVKY